MEYKRVKIQEFERYEVDTEGNVFNWKNKILKPRLAGQGKYHTVTLNSYYGRYIHRLVAQAFLPNPENKYSVNHKDGNRYNNNVSNLEWATGAEQNNHAFATGLRFAGEGVANSKLTTEQVLEIRASNMMGRDLAKKFNVSQSLISMIKHRIIWRHV